MKDKQPKQVTELPDQPKSRKPKSRGSKCREHSDFPKTNDALWYFKYPEISKTSARFAFNHRNGDKLSWEVTYATNLKFTYTAQLDPIGVYKWVLTPGISESGDDAINITSKSAWKMLNRRFRGNRTYQQSDFGIIQFAIVDFMASLAEAERVYGLLQYYALNNKQVPDKLLIALGYLPSSFTDIADYRLAINKLVLKARTLCLVKGYSLLEHALLLSANVFKDKDTARGQIYAFRKAGYWRYDPTNPNGSSLELVDYSYSYNYSIQGTDHYLRTASDIISDLQNQLNALLDDDDVDQICSDILAFYGNKEDPAELVTIASVPEDYTVHAMYSDMVNRQIHNAVFVGFNSDEDVQIFDQLTTKCPVAFNSTAPRIYQEDNVIKFNLSITNGGKVVDTEDGYAISMGNFSYTILNKYIVDTDILDPQPEDVMEMTRFSVAMKPVYKLLQAANHYRLELTAIPSTLILCASYFLINDATYSVDDTTGLVTFAVNPGISLVNFNTTNLTTAWSKFDWAPILYAVSTQGAYLEAIADLDNFILMGHSELKPMHEAALLSEFKNPIIEMILKEN